MKYLIICLFILFPLSILKAEEVSTYSDVSNIVSSLNRDIKNDNLKQLDKSISYFIDRNIRTSTGDLAIVFILNQIYSEDIESYEKHLLRLQNENPKSYVANLLLAKYYYDLAWFKRGDRFIDKTEDGKVENYKNLLDKSFSSFQLLYNLNKDSYLTNYYLFLLSKEIGSSETEREKYFSNSDSKVKNFLSLYLAKADALAPKWGGSESSLMSFVEKHAWVNDETSPLPYLVPAAFSNICNEYGGKKVLFKKPDVWDKIDKAYSILFKRFPKAAHFKINYASALIAHGEKSQAVTMIKEAQVLDPNHPEVIRLVRKYLEVE